MPQHRPGIRCTLARSVALALIGLSILLGPTPAPAAVVTQTIPWNLSDDGTLFETGTGFWEYDGIVDLSDTTIPVGDTLELRIAFQSCERLELRDATTPDGIINERGLILLSDFLGVTGVPIDVEVELLGVAGSIQNNPFMRTIGVCGLCIIPNPPDWTQTAFDFSELVLRLTAAGLEPIQFDQVVFSFQADFINILGPQLPNDPLQIVSAVTPLEYSNAVDEAVADDGTGGALEEHGLPDPGQTLYTEPLDTEGNLLPRDAIDFFPSLESGSDVTSQIDALAYGNDVHVDSLVVNVSDLLFSIVGDAGAEEWALLREAADGTLGIEYRHDDLVRGGAVAGLDDLDAAELWGTAGSDDTNYFSLQVDAASGTSVYLWYDDSPRPFIAHAEILDALEQLGYEGEPDEIDVDALMVKNVGGADCFDGDDMVVFSLRATSNGFFDGSEIMVLRPTGPPEFLQHGGVVWDSSHDLVSRIATALGVDPGSVADVDALEAIASSMTTGIAPPQGLRFVRRLDARPNPFNPATEIRFELARAARVELTVYDPRGRRVASLLDRQFSSGEHRVVWNGRADGGEAVASGVYFARLAVRGEAHTLKLVLSK